MFSCWLRPVGRAGFSLIIRMIKGLETNGTVGGDWYRQDSVSRPQLAADAKTIARFTLRTLDS